MVLLNQNSHFHLRAILAFDDEKREMKTSRKEGRMTSNQIRYQELLERNRSNLVTEAETERANKARETETNRHNFVTEAESQRANRAMEAEMNRSNLARELETARSNLAKETELHRSNKANESLKRSDLAEQARSNKANESLKHEATMVQDFGNELRAQTTREGNMYSYLAAQDKIAADAEQRQRDRDNALALQGMKDTNAIITSSIRAVGSAASTLVNTFTKLKGGSK